MIHLRPAAAQEIQRLLQQQSADGHSLRIDLQPSDCAEWSYHLSSAPQVNPEDITFAVGGLQIVVAGSVLPLVTGLTIDYAEDLMGGGFRFVNPQAQHTCGCGNAFSTSATTSTEDCQTVTAAAPPTAMP